LRDYYLNDKINLNILGFGNESKVNILFKLGIKSENLLKYRERCEMYQGIINNYNFEIIRTDYISMSMDMGIEFEKYPKYLKTKRDLALVNYKVVEDEIKDEKIRSRNAEISFLEGTFRDYIFKLHMNCKDLITEGTKLNHCVASYINRIRKGETNIIFIRRKDDSDKPSATVEFTDTEDIVQKRGFNDRTVGKDMTNAINEWRNKESNQLA